MGVGEDVYRLKGVIRSIIANYSAEVEDLILADATAGSFTVTLPPADLANRVIVKKVDSSANAITIATPGSETIDGASTATISIQYEILTFISDGSNWYIASEEVPYIPSDKLAPGAEAAHMYPKVASDNLRHSHDSETLSFSELSWIKRKTITFSKGIKGTLRIKFDMGTSDDDPHCWAKIYKNGVEVGTEQQTTTYNWETKTEDIDMGTLEPGNTIELWGKANSASSYFLKNFRIYYDNDTKPIIVEGVSNS